ncbi:MAG: putative TPR repeat methyltransferase [Cocleimonas sp.]|jgi:predicted TPR repeat methyltransferase
MTNHKNHLGQSYKLDSVTDTQAYYSDWAATYDAEIMANGYASPQRCADTLAKVTSNKKLNILDIGCGTGISGKILSDVGFSSIDGCDINPEMLKVAETRKIYKELWLSDPENPFPFENGKFDAITAVGVIGAGAAPLIVFHQAISKLTKGGLFVFSFNDHTLEDLSYEAAIDHVIESNKLELIFKEYGPHLPGRDIKSNIYVLKRL